MCGASSKRGEKHVLKSHVNRSLRILTIAQPSDRNPGLVRISVTCPAQSYTRTEAPSSTMGSTSAKTVLFSFHSPVGAALFAFMLRRKLLEHAGKHIER